MADRATWQELRKLRGIANYQFGGGIGDKLFKGDIEVTHSKRTGRIRHIYRGGKLIAAVRPTDGRITLTPHGAKMILGSLRKPPNVVVVADQAAEPVGSGRNVFAKHVLKADPQIRPMDDVIVVDSKENLLAVGRANLSGEEMLSFRKGVAVRVRHGISKDTYSKASP